MTVQRRKAQCLGGERRRPSSACNTRGVQRRLAGRAYALCGKRCVGQQKCSPAWHAPRGWVALRCVLGGDVKHDVG